MRIGLVGCGSIGRVHAAVINSMDQITLCAFADLRLNHAQEFSDMFTNGVATVYASLEEMIDNEELDSVHICTPHDCHVPMAVMVLDRDIHAFVEKPPAIDRKGFEQLKQASNSSDGRIGICFQNRYNGATKKVDALLAEGRLGMVRGGRAFVTWNRNAPYYTESDWRGSTVREGGGVLMNQSIHTLDLMLRWMGNPITVEASMHNHRLKGIVEVEDTLEAYLTFSKEEDPVRASFYATNTYVSDAPVFIEIFCENGFVRMEGSRVSYQGPGDNHPLFWQEEISKITGKPYWGNGHPACIHDFYRTILSGELYANRLSAVENTFQIMIDIYESAGRLKVEEKMK